MNANKLIKKNIYYSIGMALIGALCLGFYFLRDGGEEMAVFLALGAAFSIMGILNAIIYTVGKNNKKIKDTAIAENDERTNIIRGKAGVITSKIMFVMIMVALVFEPFFDISLRWFIIFELMFLIIVYAVAFTIGCYKN